MKSSIHARSSMGLQFKLSHGWVLHGIENYGIWLLIHAITPNWLMEEAPVLRAGDEFTWRGGRVVVNIWQIFNHLKSKHDDVIKGKHIPRYWALHKGNPPVSDVGFWFVFFDMRLNKRLIKQSRYRWFETPSCLLWRHCNASGQYIRERWITPRLFITFTV